LRTESACTQRCDQIRTERQVWQWNCTVSVIASPLKNGSVTPTASSKEMAAMYNFRSAICLRQQLFNTRTKNNTSNNASNDLIPNQFQTSLLHNTSFFRFFNKKYFFRIADKHSKHMLFFQNEQKHSTLTLSNSLIGLLKFYIFLNSLHSIERSVYELLTTFESSYFKSRFSQHRNYVFYPGKFMDVFDILQMLGNKFCKNLLVL
jgi:hypothetical protein